MVMELMNDLLLANWKSFPNRTYMFLLAQACQSTKA